MNPRDGVEGGAGSLKYLIYANAPASRMEMRHLDWLKDVFWKIYRQATIKIARMFYVTPPRIPTRSSLLAWEVGKAFGTDRAMLDNISESGETSTDVVINSVTNLITTAWATFISWRAAQRDKPSICLWSYGGILQAQQFCTLFK